MAASPQFVSQTIARQSIRCRPRAGGGRCAGDRHRCVEGEERVNMMLIMHAGDELRRSHNTSQSAWNQFRREHSQRSVQPRRATGPTTKRAWELSTLDLCLVHKVLWKGVARNLSQRQKKKKEKNEKEFLGCSSYNISHLLPCVPQHNNKTTTTTTATLWQHVLLTPSQGLNKS